jgi:hypothetical protein
MAYRILLDSISNALDDILNYRPIVAVGFIVPKAHLAPMGNNRIPVNLDDPVVDLFA